MTSERSELSSMTTQLQELTERLGRVGERLDSGTTESAALALFEAERALRTALRALDRASGQLTD